MMPYSGNAAMSTPDKNRILAILTEEWNRNGPPGIMDINDIAAAAKFSRQETFAALSDLFENGLVDMNKFKTAAFLTPEGYSAAGSI
jgi:hypothetical protein